MCMRCASLASPHCCSRPRRFAADDARGRRAERQRADALRREGQCLSQARIAARCAASRSRRCIRPTSAPSWSTARPSTCTTAPISTAAPFITEQPRRITIYETTEWQLVGHHHSELLAQDHRAGARRRPGRDRRCTCCSSGRARRTAPRKCWCSIRRTATGARARCRRRTCAGAPTARRSWSGRSRSKERPIVDITEVVFDPATRTFRLQFARGGSATLRLETLDIERRCST